ncbi:hypothetical protein [Vibrio phage BUCT194]|uniref:Uncharacterized protein n=1 Tax=Vibrio phage BUCT194 TaxID=2859072 RepID=A0AAE9BP32_9CAUD|nr:hypothetical protein PP741_gp073 [Vibrio phage BUCT194]UAW01152.1 hypothetical protein [Vibrio phage BUCT194]
MGLFSESRTVIASSTQTLIEDTPDYLKQAIFNAVLAGREIVPDILDAQMYCFANADVEKMYRYARDKYTNGLPEGTKGWAPPNYETIIEVLKKEYPNQVAAGRTFRIVTASVGPMNGFNVAMERFVEDPKFVRWGNIYQPTNPDRDFGKAFVYNGWGSDGNNQGYEITRTETNYEGHPIFIRAQWVTDPNQMRPFRNFTYSDYHEPINNDENAVYYTVEYQLINRDGSIYKDNKFPTGTRFWSYAVASKRYPELNTEDDGGSTITETFYFPVVPLRVNNKDLLAPSEQSKPLYKTSKKLLKYIDLDIEELREGVNNNPDIADIDHAYVVFGIDAHTDSQAGMRYLFEYFEDEYTRAKTGETEYLGWRNSSSYSYFHPPINVIEISDGTYKIQLGFAYITIQQYNGKIGPVNYCDKSMTLPVTDLQRSRPPGMTTMWYEDHNNYLTLRKQVTENSYRVIKVHGLIHSNNIYGANQNFYTVLRSGNPLVIPLNVAIAQTLPTKDANKLYYESFKIVFNAFEKVKLEWYQTGFFQFVTQVISIAFGAVAGGFNAMATSITTAVSSGVIAVGILIGQIILKSILASALFSFVADELGLEVAFGIAAVLTISGLFTDMPYAADMAQVGIGLLDASQEYLAEQFAEIQALMAANSAEYNEAMDELIEEYNKLQGSLNLNTVGLFTDVGMMPMESATSYVNRMTGAGIFNTTSIDVSSYVDTALNLNRGMV